MSEATWITGDALTVMRTMPDASVDLVLFSPPFLALRSYLPADHPDKAAEVGSEATPGLFVDSLMLVVEECRRVLAPHGSLCIELGDTFAGSGGAGGDYNADGLREGQPKFRAVKASPDAPRSEGGMRDMGEGVVAISGGTGWPLAKSLTMVPELVRLTMAYGFNPLTGRETPQWRIRNVIRWVRPNPPVGALGDKFRPATTDMLVACVSGRRFFDLDAVRTEHKHGEAKATGSYHHGPGGSRIGGGDDKYGTTVREIDLHPAGAPPLDYWEIPTQPYKGAHYATWPKALVLRPIKAMCPERVCNVCGLPSTRITEKTPEYAAFRAAKNAGDHGQTDHTANVGNRDQGWDHQDDSAARGEKTTTVGWSDCGHNDWRRGIVLDPFAGSGTTLEVATGLGRDAIGIDLDARNLELARRRVGMFLVEA